MGRIPITLDDAADRLCRRLRDQGIRKLQLPPGFGQRHDGITFGGTIVELANVHHIYEPDVHALRGVSLSVREREMVGIIGQNGSGKTTMARHMVGLLKPTNRDARVVVAGTNVVRQPLHKTIQLINYIFQNPDDQLFAETVYDEVAFAPKMIGLKGEALDRAVTEALEAFDIHHFSREYILGLPENIKTYLAICCVLPLHPKVLLIDEPTTGLDTQGEVLMMQNIRKLRDHGETIIIITHNMKTVAAHCDRTVVMRRGEIICDGETRDVYTQHDLLAKADIKPPQITQLGARLAEFGLTPTVLTVDEMYDILTYNLLSGKA
jgi:energy-coupling factor transport system ATP-binding protein